MNTNGHYNVTYRKGGAYDGEVKSLKCCHCPFFVVPRSYHRAGDRSGQGRYNRARGAIVKHLHERHPDAMKATARGIE